MLRATLLTAAPLPMPSASGIEIVGETAFVVSDDSPLLYAFSAADLRPLPPLELFKTAHFSDGRIPKKHKPDLEALAFLPATATEPAALLIAGSGTKSKREGGFWVEFDAQNQPGAPQPVSLSALYAALRAVLPAGQRLNLEALATTPTELLLFQRPAGTTAGRQCFGLALAEVRALLGPGTAPRAAPTFRHDLYDVPSLDGYPGGLSGAVVFEGILFVTVSVEITDDPVRDGEVLGSFVGLLDPQHPTKGQFVHLTWPDGRAFHEKVEGIAVRQRTATGYELLLVTDDDRGGSLGLVVAADLA